MALGGVYVPSSSDPLDALASNPAGLTVLGSRAADLSLGGAFSRGSFTNSVNSNAPLQSPPGAMPYGAYGAPIGKSRFSFAVGGMPEVLSAPKWNYVDAPGAAGASYGLQKYQSSIIAMRLAAGVGVYLGPKLSLGASFGEDFDSNTLEGPTTFQTQPQLKGFKTLLDMHAKGFGWNTSFGVLARPSRNVQISVAWKSRTVVDGTGKASGDLTQQFAALGIPAPPKFVYTAGLHQVLPQSVIAGATWRLNPRWMLAVQGDWIGWRNAFNDLPIALTNGNNAFINGFVNSTSLYETIPFQWKDQISVHAGFERMLTESISVSGGFAHANNPVPGSTLSPLTAAILSNQITTGIGYTRGRTRIDAAYGFDPITKGSVGQTALLSGEYNNSSVRLGIQAVTVSMSRRF
jgi:long-chain fatty acid transport protein